MGPAAGLIRRCLKVKAENQLISYNYNIHQNHLHTHMIRFENTPTVILILVMLTFLVAIKRYIFNKRFQSEYRINQSKF